MTKEEAIRCIKKFGLYHAIGDLPNSAKTVEAFRMAIEALKDRTQGEWIARAIAVGDKEYIEYSRCSECGELAFVRMNYCPNCGADMRGKE